jgi:hypothetical protein
VKLRVVCAWCKKIMGEKEVKDLPVRLFGITHSICFSCSDDVFAELEDTLRQSDHTETNRHRKEIVK